MARHHSHSEPEHTEHVSHSTHHTPYRAEHHAPGHVHEDMENHPGGHGVMGDLERAEAMRDSPVPEHHQMPDKGTSAHAAQVVAAMEQIGSEFHPDGVMHRD